MSARSQIAAILYKAVMKDRLSFHSAIKLFSKVDPVFSRHMAASGKFARKKLIEHMTKATAPEGKRAWTSIAFPAEILYPFGILPMTLEVMAGLFATMGLSENFLDLSDAADIPNTMCSFHRVLLGVSSTDFLSEPMLVGATSIFCDGNLKSFTEAAKNKNVPFIFIDVPYELTKDSVHYLKDQLTHTVATLEEITGKKLGPESFLPVVENANKSFRLLRKFYNLRTTSNVNQNQGHEMANFAFPLHFLLGSQPLVDILEKRCEGYELDADYNKFFEAKEFSKSAKRILWLHIVPQYDTELWHIVDNGEDSRIVCDEYSSPYADDYDVKDPLASIAKRLISHPLNGTIERRLENILKIAKDFKVDGIIHYSSWGCHQAAGNVQLLGTAIQDAGYKFLNLNGDPVDPRNTSIEQHRTRIEAFLDN